MIPNQNFLTYFPEVDLPELKYNPDRSSCLNQNKKPVISSGFMAKCYLSGKISGS